MNSSPLPETGMLAVGDVAALAGVMGTFILRRGRRDLVAQLPLCGHQTISRKREILKYSLGVISCIDEKVKSLGRRAE